MKLQSIATLLSIAHSLSATTGVLANEESVKNVRGERKLQGQGGGNPVCNGDDYEGVWAYVSQGTGNSFSTMITCPPFLNGDCQIMDQGLNTKDCSIIGMIKTTDMFSDGGNCAFKPVRMGLVNSNDFKQCPTIVSAVRDGGYLLFSWGDKPNPDLENPVYYNAGTPRHGLRINMWVLNKDPRQWNEHLVLVPSFF